MFGDNLALLVLPQSCPPTMSSASSSSFSRAGKIALGVAGALTVATVAWAAVFDYRRRNDPAFRRKLGTFTRSSGRDAEQLQRAV